ncbi:transposase [Micromonospora sp. NPDC050795]|uniref:transposase n=1 Tax=Micromonospora sp. NPDC050795 TaxID=3364282 RepID=UPI0037B9F4A3
MSLVGPGGLLAGITRTVLESTLDAERDAHLDEVGLDEANGRRTFVTGTVRRRCRPRSVRWIQMPRGQAGSFTPRIVPKHVRRLRACLGRFVVDGVAG